MTDESKSNWMDTVRLISIVLQVIIVPSLAYALYSFNDLKDKVSKNHTQIEVTKKETETILQRIERLDDDRRDADSETKESLREILKKLDSKQDK